MKELLKRNAIIMKTYNLYDYFKRKIMYYISPILLTKYLYKRMFNKKINLESPETFNEKIMWLKLYYYNNNCKVKNCIDKYNVRKYIESKKLANILVKNIGIYNNPNEIDYNSLPSSFVLKCTTGSGNNIIVRDKEKINFTEVQKIMNKWQKEKYEQKYAEVQYKKIPRRIVCEEYLGDNIVDYKFFCFHGIPRFLYVSAGLGEHENMKMNYLDMNFKSLGITRDNYSALNINKPKNFDKMVEVSKILSSDFPFVRVDLYNINGKIYFSELTFVPTGGFMKVKPEEYDKIWGKYLDLSKIKK